MGKIKENEIQNRDEIIKIRVSKKEKEIIKERVKYLGFNSLSTYLRKVAIDTNVYNIDLTPIIGVKTELNRIGNNINQLVKKANSLDDNSLKNDVELLKKYYAEIKEKSELLNKFTDAIKGATSTIWQ